MSGPQTHYSSRDIEARILAAVRAAGLNAEKRLSPVVAKAARAKSRVGSRNRRVEVIEGGFA